MGMETTAPIPGFSRGLLAFQKAIEEVTLRQQAEARRTRQDTERPDTVQNLRQSLSRRPEPSKGGQVDLFA